MKFIFWLSFFLIAYVYAGYPLILLLLNVFCRKRRVVEDIEPPVSLLIPAHNEEELIAGKIENSLKLVYPSRKLEVIVCSDGSTDSTNAIVRRYENRNVVLDYAPQRVGKCAALYRGIKRAQGEIIVFSDADATLKEDSLRRLTRNFADERIGCVEGVRRDVNEKGILLDSLYWKYETLLKKLNSRLHSLVGATGAIYAVRKELYSPLTPERGDDFEVPIRVLLQGYDCVLEPEALAYHPWLSNKDEFGRIVRIVSWMMPSALMLIHEAWQKKKWLIFFQLVSHKLLRWFVPVFMIALLAVNLWLTAGVYRYFLGVQLIFYIAACIVFVFDKVRIKIFAPLKIPYFFCLINFASLIGISRSVFGTHQMNWIKTARKMEKG